MTFRAEQSEEEAFVISMSLLVHSLIQSDTVPLVVLILNLQQILLSTSHYHPRYCILICPTLQKPFPQHALEVLMWGPDTLDSRFQQ